MKALTLHQPVASLMGPPPFKDIENRTWRPPDLIMGQRIALHAGLKWNAEYALWIRMVAPELESHVRCASAIKGCIVSTAIVLDWYDEREEDDDIEMPDPEPRESVRPTYVEDFTGLTVDSPVCIPESRWFLGPVGWLLTDIIRLSVPIPCRGAQGSWTVPDDVFKRIEPEAGS